MPRILPRDFGSLSIGVLVVGTGLFDDGSAALPSISFVADPNTGLYRPAADSVAIATGGVERVRVTNTGLEVNSGALSLVQPADATQIMSRMVTADTDSADFIVVVQGNDNAGSARRNQTFTWGYNYLNSALEVGGEPALAWRIESFYSPVIGNEYFEAHLEYRNAAAAGFRPFAVQINRNTDSIALSLLGDNISILNAALTQLVTIQGDQVRLVNSTNILAAVNNVSVINQNKAGGGVVSLIFLNASDEVALGNGATAVSLVGLVNGSSTWTVSGTGAPLILKRDGDITAEIRAHADAGSPHLVGRRSRGTEAAPTQLLTSNELLELAVIGYHSGGAYSSTYTGWRVQAAQAWTAGAQGYSHEWYTVANGATSQTLRMTLFHNGVLRIASGGRIELDGDGSGTALYFGASQDVALYRGGANQLALASGDDFYMISGNFAIGEVPLSQARFDLAGTTTASGGFAWAYRSDVNLTAAANNDRLDQVGLWTGTTIAKGAFTGLEYNALDIDGSAASATGAGTIDVASAIRVRAAPTIGTNNYSIFVEAGTVRFDGRLLTAQGSDVASADEIALGADGNYFDITGAVQINHINNTGWIAGTIVVLQFDGAPTVVHNSAAPAGTEASILLAGAVNFVATAGDTLVLIYGGTTFRELARTVI